MKRINPKIWLWIYIAGLSPTYAVTYNLDYEPAKDPAQADVSTAYNWMKSTAKAAVWPAYWPSRLWFELSLPLRPKPSPAKAAEGKAAP